MRRALGASQPAFFGAFVAGFFYRFLFLLGSVWLLRNEKYIITIAFASAMIIVQLVFEAVPLSGPWISKKS
jgi:vacuolar-type H+-ATPase subunit I/STV1